MLSALVKIGIAFADALVVYVALFMYETEQGQWQSRLEDLWLQIKYRDDTAASTTSSLFSKVAQVVTRLFDNMFGHKLLSWRFAAASVVYSIAANLLLNVWHQFTSCMMTSFDTNSVASMLMMFGVACVMVVPIYGRTPKWDPIYVAAAPLFVVMFIFLVVAFDQPAETLENVLIACLIVAASIVSDMLVTLLIRRIVLHLQHSGSLLTTFAFLVLQAILVTVIFALPWEASGGLYGHSAAFVPSRFQQIAEYSGVVAVANLSTVVIATIFTLTMLVLLLHRFTWGVLSRLIYPLLKFHIVRDTKSLLAIAAVLTTVLITPGPAWKNIIEIVKHKITS